MIRSLASARLFTISEENELLLEVVAEGFRAGERILDCPTVQVARIARRLHFLWR